MEEQGYEYSQIETKPAPCNSILWNANVELEDAYLIGGYSLFDSKPIEFKRYLKNHDLLGTLRNEDKINRLIDISNGWFIISEEKGGLYFNDLRFGVLDTSTEKPNFVFSYRLLPTKDALKVEEVERNPEEAKKLMMGLGNRILGN